MRKVNITLELATIENISILEDKDTKSNGLYAELKMIQGVYSLETCLCQMPTMESLMTCWDFNQMRSGVEHCLNKIEAVKTLLKTKGLDSYKDLKGTIVVCAMDGNTLKDIDLNPTVDGLTLRSKFDDNSKTEN